jgi:hypothetical protein
VTATRVFFDKVSATICIDGVAPYPAHALVASYDGFVLWGREPTGRGVFALPYNEISDYAGNPMTGPEAALAYLEDVFGMSLNIDGGSV